MMNPGSFCEHCGAALRSGSRFCEGCGQPVAASGGVAAPPMPVAPSLVCGTCRMGDQVVAASAYQPSTDPEVKGDDERVSPDMVQSLLEAPEKPGSSSVLSWALAPFIPLVLFFVYWFAPIHQGFKYFLFGWTVMFWASVFVPALSASELYPFIGLLHLLLYWVALFMGRDQANVKLLTQELPSYNARLARWQRMQYCKRCQKVWLDHAPAASRDLTEYEALLNG